MYNHACNYQEIENGNIVNQIHGFTIDYGKFILIYDKPRAPKRQFMQRKGGNDVIRLTSVGTRTTTGTPKPVRRLGRERRCGRNSQTCSIVGYRSFCTVKVIDVLILVFCLSGLLYVKKFTIDQLLISYNECPGGYSQKNLVGVCGPLPKFRVRWRTRSVENAECGKCGV